MNRLIQNARWMDGAVWFVLMSFIWLVYETQFLGAPLTVGLIVQVILVWGAAGAGFAVLSGYFAERFGRDKEE